MAENEDEDADNLAEGQDPAAIGPEIEGDEAETPQDSDAEAMAGEAIGEQPPQEGGGDIGGPPDEGEEDFEEDISWDDEDSYWDFGPLLADNIRASAGFDWSLEIEPDNSAREMLGRITSQPGLWVVPDLHDRERELLLKWLFASDSGAPGAGGNIFVAHPVEGIKTSEKVLLGQMLAWHSDGRGHACYVVDPNEHSVFFNDTEVESFLSELKKAGISILLFSRGKNHSGLRKRGATVWRPDFYTFWWRCFTENFFESESADVVEGEFARASALLENKRQDLLGRTPTRAKVLRLRRLILDTPEIPDRESELGDVIQQVMDAFETHAVSDGSRLREAHNEVFRISLEQADIPFDRREGRALLEPEATALFVAWNCLKYSDGKPVQLMDFEEIFDIQLKNMAAEQNYILAAARQNNKGKKSKKKDLPAFDAGHYRRHRLFASQGDMMLEYIGLDVTSSPLKGKQISFRHPDLLDHLDDIFSRRRANYAAAQIDRFFVDKTIWQDGQDGVQSYANMLMILKFRQYGPISDPRVARRCVGEMLKDFRIDWHRKLRKSMVGKRYLRVVEFTMLWLDEQQKLSPDAVEDTTRAFKDFVTLLCKELMKRGGWLDFVYLFEHMARQRPELLDATAILRMVNENAPFETKWDILSIVERDAIKQAGNDLQYRIFKFLAAEIDKKEFGKSEEDNDRFRVYRDAFMAGLALRVLPLAVRRLKAGDYAKDAPAFSDGMLEKILADEDGIQDLVRVLTAPRVRDHLDSLLKVERVKGVFHRFTLQEFMRIEEMCYAMQIKPLENEKGGKSEQKSHEEFHQELYRAYMKDVRDLISLVENLPVISGFNTRNPGRGAVGTARGRALRLKKAGEELVIPFLRAHLGSTKARDNFENIKSLNLLVFVELHGALLCAGRDDSAKDILQALKEARLAAKGAEERAEIRACIKAFDARLTRARLVQKRGLVTMVKNARQELKMQKISQEYCEAFEAFLRKRHGFIDNFSLAGTSVRRTE